MRLCAAAPMLFPAVPVLVDSLASASTGVADSFSAASAAAAIGVACGEPEPCCEVEASSPELWTGCEVVSVVSVARAALAFSGAIGLEALTKTDTRFNLPGSLPRSHGWSMARSPV